MINIILDYNKIIKLLNKDLTKYFLQIIFNNNKYIMFLYLLIGLVSGVLH